MIKDFLISFKDNFKEKTRNPFLGTYLFVWLVRNWELVYTLFNFDKGCTLADKVSFIENYYAKIDFLTNLGTNIFWAIGLLILTYLLLNISRLIVNIFEKQLTPWIYKITDSKSIVLKTVYQHMVSERDDLQTRLDQERESKSRLESRIKKLEEDLFAASSAKQEVKEEKPITEPKEEKKTPIRKNDDSTRILFNKVKDKQKLGDFMKIAAMINKGESIHNDSKEKEYFIELGLITYTKSAMGPLKFYKLTQDGENVLKLARLE